ncbi:Hemolysin E [Pseudolycoriella hygida]|uniref:Hemolysin E n=1 Tax=Pseudolycoriella hygida TaxID=35572 RepID=A0A9Q0MKW1_9DIPT|nr:Hemolysin E [Pseudolycoriella hygida]
MAAKTQAITLTKQSIDSLNSVLSLYSTVLDRIIPWGTFNNTIKELDRYRDDYSNESGQLVNEIKNLMNRAQSCYDDATQSIYNWCSVAKQLLEKYFKIFDNRQSNAFQQIKEILIMVLAEGVKHMGAGQDKLNESSTSFNNAAGKLSTLYTRFNNEFDSKSSYYLGKVDQIRKEAYASAAAGAIAGPFGLLIAYAIAAGTVEGKLIPELNQKLNEVKNFFNHLKSLITQADGDIDSTKNKLRAEISNIGELKTQAEASKTVIEMDELDALREAILSSVKTLINQCDDYQRNHGRKH